MTETTVSAETAKTPAAISTAGRVVVAAILLMIPAAGVFNAIVLFRSENRLLAGTILAVTAVVLLAGGYLLRRVMAIDARSRRVERINRVLIGISGVVNATFDLDALYPSVHRSLGDIIDVTNFFIALYDRKANAIRFPYYRDQVDTAYPTIENIEHSGALTAKVILSRQPVHSTRAQTLAWARQQGAPVAGTVPAVWLGVPLKIKNEVIGVMATQHYHRATMYDETDVAVMVSVSDQVAIAIERRQREAALRQSVRQYRILAENHRDVVVAISPEGRLTYCSPAIREFGGYEPAEVIGRHFSDFFADPVEMNRGVRSFTSMVRKHRTGNFEMLFKARHDVSFPVEVGLKPMVQSGAVVSVMCVMRDISERKAAEIQLKHARDALEIRVRERTDALVKINEQLEDEVRKHQLTERVLRVSEQKHRTLMENIPDVIYSTDAQGKIVTVNNPSENFFGYRTEDVLGRHFSLFLHPEDRRYFAGLVEKAIADRIELTKGFQGRLVAKDGSTCWVEANLRRQFDAEGRYVRTDGVLRDITHTRMLQERLIRSERLAATGQLAASIAHEINSPLQGVTSLLNVIRREYGGDADLVAHLDLIKGAFNSIRNTVKNLMDLNRPGKERNQPIYIQAILGQTGALVKSYLRDNGVLLHLDLPADLPVTMGSPQQLGQVFMNLINNAVEAMGANPQSVEKSITIKATLEDNQLVVRVCDTGTGISEEDMGNLFDAFFTRKKRMGMGVGLSICHRIIEDHSGTITVSNRKPRGAEFTIRLPAGRAESAD